ncbi:ABC transporter permease [Chamaesiphon minutus]|uniref:ABC-type antimicrobial peptide transport system, permease component n=1 Tax=Chamaesiphon minutus (strain ATCC 27169 / PCC 6605) TaxID=1173020 RepID=K9U9B5_CHAP6|nr:ABC transporter permease [Chamaesiphon minutus]AFY91410.1 ABC-type antimicrobial peptide transport system, permease component [Chamaesiphon minutus PCC 6605]
MVLFKQRPHQVSTWEISEMAIEALWSNKLRSGLTMLGVIIGISSTIGISSIGQGVQKSTADSIRGLGTDVLQVMAGAAQSGGISQGQGSLTTLNWEDAKAIAEQAPGATVVSAFLQRNTQVVYGEKNTSTTVYGTDLSYSQARNTFPKSGRFFDDEELKSAASVAVIAPTVQKNLFPANVDPIGTKIRIQGEIYEVIGVMEVKGSQGPQDRDDAVYIPLTSMSARIVGNNSLMGISINGIYIKGRDESQLEIVKFQVANILRLRHNIDTPEDDDFKITNQADILKTFDTIFGLLTTLIIAIAGISLVVGGIGIANIMLVSVVERTREIGIRKALGATDRAILTQFLTESVIISVVGGSIGIILGIGITFVSATAFKFAFLVSGNAIAIGFGLSTAVGLLAGVIPAKNAAKLDPIVALRSD